MAQYLRIKNWEEFQHYKDRNPPWIKLHRDLLRDYNFTCLQDASKLHLMLIWLLASQMDNKIPADEEFIKNQIGIKGKINLNELINKGFLVDDSNTLASRKQSAMPETETETKTKTDILPDFDKFYEIYPRHVGKEKALSAYNKRIKEGVSHEEIIRGVKAYNEEIRKKCTDKQYIAHPASWLNAGRWEDEYESKEEVKRSSGASIMEEFRNVGR